MCYRQNEHLNVLIFTQKHKSFSHTRGQVIKACMYRSMGHSQKDYIHEILSSLSFEEPCDISYMICYLMALIININ